MMKARSIILILAIILSATYISAQGELTPQQIITKSAATISASSARTIKFTLSSTKGKINGTLTGKSNKFFLDTPEGKIWYDGSVMTSYNPRAKEATKAHPTPSELRETNPFLYISAWQKNFNVSKATSVSHKKYIIILTPKNKNTEVIKAVLSINAHNFHPIKLVINLKNKEMVAIDVKSITSDVSMGDATFRFPVKKYPNTEIIDLTR